MPAVLHAMVKLHAVVSAHTVALALGGSTEARPSSCERGESARGITPEVALEGLRPAMQNPPYPGGDPADTPPFVRRWWRLP